MPAYWVSCCWAQIKEATGCRMRIIEAVPGADERVVVISSPDDPSQDRISAEVRRCQIPSLLQFRCRRSSRRGHCAAYLDAEAPRRGACVAPQPAALQLRVSLRITHRTC